MYISVKTEVREVEKVVRTTQKVKTGAVIELTKDEVADLMRVCYHIGGDLDTTPRGTTTAIYRTLSSLGFEKSDVQPLEGMTF